MKKIVNGICVALAFVCVGLGVIGMVLPILPTTPLFIAAACLFAKGSEKFHTWFLNTSLYKRYIESAVKNGTMEKKAKRNMMLTLGVNNFSTHFPTQTEKFPHLLPWSPHRSSTAVTGRRRFCFCRSPAMPHLAYRSRHCTHCPKRQKRPVPTAPAPRSPTAAAAASN